MEQNGITPEDIMKDITADEAPVEVVAEAVEEAPAEAVAEAVEEAPVEEVVEEAPVEEAIMAETAAEESDAVAYVVEEPPVNGGYYAAQETPANLFAESPAYGFQNDYATYNAAPEYAYEPVGQNVGGEGFCIAALVLGIVALFLNPCYIVSILAIVFGFVGQGKNNSKKALAIWGWALGFASILVQVVADILLSIFSGGMGTFVFCC